MTSADLASLINQSLALWGVPASVRACPGQRPAHLEVNVNRSVNIVHIASAGVGNFWQLTINGRTEELISVLALLRALRQHLDSDYLPDKVIIGVRPMLEHG